MLKSPATFPLIVDNKTVGRTTLAAGAKVRILERRDTKVLVAPENRLAAPVWLDHASIAVLPSKQALNKSPNADRTTKPAPLEPQRSPRQVEAVAAEAVIAAEVKAESAALTQEQDVKPLSEPGDTSIRFWADKEKNKPGLIGYYFDRKLGGSETQDLKSLAPSRRRIDTEIEFESLTWGNRKKMRISGGHEKRWQDFSVQWEGWIELNRPGRVAFSADDGSRFWLDLDKNGEFGNSPDEFWDNGWGKGGPSYSASNLLAAGLYPIRIQYEGGIGENHIRLESPDGSVSYLDFEGTSHRLYPWIGRNVALLTKSQHYDAGLISRLLSDIDQAYDYFVLITGREPPRAKSLSGRNTVAELQRTCGAGCGLVGATGVELAETFFQKLIKGYERDGSFNHLIFWEFSRNFWFHDGQLNFSSPDIFDPGAVYATVMQALCLRAANLKPDEELERVTAEIEQQIDVYAKNQHMNFENTVRKGKGACGGENRSQWLMASAIFRLYRDYGGDSFLARFWQAMTHLEPAKSTQDAVDNFAFMACEAAGLNLTPLLQNEWKLPLSTKAESKLTAKFGRPVASTKP